MDARSLRKRGSRGGAAERGVCWRGEIGRSTFREVGVGNRLECTVAAAAARTAKVSAGIQLRIAALSTIETPSLHAHGRGPGKASVKIEHAA